MSVRSWSVEQLISYLKNRLENDAYLSSLWVKGEISNFVNHSSGHFYFTLKDEKAAISCVMFSTYARRVNFKITEGMKVLLSGKPSIYDKTGRLQLYVYDIQQDGIGLLYQRFEELKKKLYLEGYFREEHKKPLPKYPFDIAVISGEKTAAHSDIMTTLKRRWPVAKVTDYFSLVQGEAAAANIVSQIEAADAAGHDVILLARGGGSLEDLWCFNEESVVKAIYNCNTPIITGIGHEVDFTLSDFAADVRANTPTGAAELCAPRLEDVISEIRDKRSRMIQSVTHQTKLYENRLAAYKDQRLKRLKDHIIQKDAMQLMMNIDALSRYPQNVKQMYEGSLQLNLNKIIQKKEMFVAAAKYQLDSDYAKMVTEVKNRLQNTKDNLRHSDTLLNAYSPTAILSRGYSIVLKDGKAVKSVEEVREKDILNVRVASGSFTAEVKDKGE